MTTISQIPVQWISVTEAAERLEVSSSKVRRLIEEKSLLATSEIPGLPQAIPADFLVENVKKESWQVLPSLGGTITLLLDNRFSEHEALQWLLQTHEELGQSPLDTLRGGNKSGVRRLIQLEAI